MDFLFFSLIFSCIFIICVFAWIISITLKEKNDFNTNMLSENGKFEDDTEFMDIYNSYKEFYISAPEIKSITQKRTLQKKVLCISTILFIIVETLILNHILPSSGIIGLIVFPLFALPVWCSISLYLNKSLFKIINSQLSYSFFVKKIFKDSLFIEEILDAKVYKEDCNTKAICNFKNSSSSSEHINTLKNILENYANSDYTYLNFSYNIAINNAIIDQKK